MLSLDKPGYRALLLGNEAIARGAIEGGICVATSYPGTPSTEIMEALSSVAKEIGIYVEWSVNEKVALEVAFAASISGLRSMTSMKHVGINVALDSLISMGYTGVKGGLIVVSAEDPSMYSSQNEQDNRLIGIQSYIPIFEPSDQHEAKDIVSFMLDFSEKLEVPTILRTTTRLSHTRGVVTYGKIRERRTAGEFIKDIKRWVLIPAYARIRRRVQLEKWKNVEREVNHIPFTEVKYNGDTGIIAVGQAYNYLMEALNILGVDNVSILKLAVSVPIPHQIIGDFINKCNRILIIEELEPVVEMQVKSYFYNHTDVEIYGKDYINIYGELTVDSVLSGVAKFLGLKQPNYKMNIVQVDLPSRPPVLCPGCPHRATFFATRKAVNMSKVKAVYPGDIGCYTLGVFPPYKMVDTTISMGSGIGIANGLAHFQNDVVIAMIGDSTFYHAGIPALINAVYNKSPVILIVMDNEVTAMTGDQPNPGSGYTAMGEKTKRIPAENIAKGIGVEKILVTDPYNIKSTVDCIKEAIQYVLREDKPAVVVSRRTCMLGHIRKLARKGVSPPTYFVDPDKCTGCKICTEQFACPAIYMVNGKAAIDEKLCAGCGVCAQICPFKAFIRRGSKHD